MVRELLAKVGVARRAVQQTNKQTNTQTDKQTDASSPSVMFFFYVGGGGPMTYISLLFVVISLFGQGSLNGLMRGLWPAADGHGFSSVDAKRREWRGRMEGDHDPSDTTYEPTEGAHTHEAMSLFARMYQNCVNNPDPATTDIFDHTWGLDHLKNRVPFAQIKQEIQGRGLKCVACREKRDFIAFLHENWGAPMSEEAAEGAQQELVGFVVIWVGCLLALVAAYNVAKMCTVHLAGGWNGTNGPIPTNTRRLDEVLQKIRKMPIAHYQSESHLQSNSIVSLKQKLREMDVFASVCVSIIIICIRKFCCNADTCVWRGRFDGDSSSSRGMSPANALPSKWGLGLVAKLDLTFSFWGCVAYR